MSEPTVPRIRVLDKHTAELIAAGEVVDRPASVVKELTENSIDALADSVTVEIAGGGVRLIRVADNGCGIAREDVPKAFLRHGTSKIRTAEDLNRIGSLGFRGEALASVAAVARVELVTRTREDDAGVRYRIEGGEERGFEDAGCPVGTSITVRDLFYNTPARMKFLKKDATEGAAVAAVMDRIALSHPEISFRFVREGKEVLLTPGDGKLRSAVHAVFGKEFVDGLIPVKYRAGAIYVSGYVSKPHAARANRNMQLFYINDRFVRSRTMTAALEGAYKGTLMTGKFPSCVLFLSVSFDQVDVNVHPAKSEVRFSDERAVFDAVYRGVRAALTARDTPPELKTAVPEVRGKTAFVSDFVEDRGEQTVLSRTVAPPSPPPAPETTVPKGPVLRFEDSHPAGVSGGFRPADGPVLSAETRVPPPAISRPFASELPPLTAAEGRVILYRAEPAQTPQSAASSNPPAAVEDAAPGTQDPDALPVRFVGEAFGTYAVLETEDGLLFVDKHAAHERILYNRLLKTARTDAQMLLEPVAVTLTKDEYAAVIEHLDLLAEAGIEAEDFGGRAVLVRAVPAVLAGEDIPGLLAEAAENLLRDGRLSPPRKYEELLHSVACKAAVKAGGKTDRRELLALAREIFRSGEVRYCPHGRPVSFLIRKKEIEKQFGRIR